MWGGQDLRTIFSESALCPASGQSPSNDPGTVLVHSPFFFRVFITSCSPFQFFALQMLLSKQLPREVVWGQPEAFSGLSYLTG